VLCNLFSGCWTTEYCCKCWCNDQPTP